MLSRNHHLTKLMLLRCHKKVYHNGVKQTLNELPAEFRINRGRSYVQLFYLQTSSIPKLQLPKKLKFTIVSDKCYIPFQACGVENLGPLYVKDIYYMEFQFRWCALVGRILGKIGWNGKNVLEKVNWK